MRRLVATLLTTVLVAVGLAAPAAATGSGVQMPTDATCGAGGSCRPAIEWRTGYYGPSWDAGIPRRTLFSVYAVAGEQILLGSSSLPATGAGASDIVVWNPGVVPDAQAETLPAPQFSCVAQRATTGNGSRGFIANRAEERAGAESIDGTGNPAGYRPCSYTAPATGVYRVAFYGTAGGSANTEAAPNGAIAPSGAFAVHATAVNAWDVTVRPAAPASTADVPGRLFTYVYAGFTGGNPRPVEMTMYLTTLDGFRYRVSTNGFDPNGFVFYGNRVGFLDADGSPLNRDIVPLPGSSDQQVMRQLAGGVGIAPPEYPLSFEPLAPETLGALGVPTVPVEPVVSAISYSGQVTTRGSYVGRGGEFQFTAGSAGTYEIVLSRDGADFDPGLSTNRSLRGVVDGPGTYTAAWDGLDNARDDFPVGDDFAFTVTLRGGEYHAPMIDVESSVRGGPAIALENPPNGRCPFTGAVSDGSNCTRAFYDDRAYVTADGTQIGDATTGQLCSALVRDAGMPLTTFANPVTGFDSAGTGRAFGTTTSTNRNVACGPTPSTLGDARGLDLWTYFPSTTVGATLDVLPLPAAPVADDDAYATDAGTPLVVPAATGVLAGDTGTGLTVTSSTTPAQGTLTLDEDGALTYTPATAPDFSGTVTFGYTVTDDAGQTDTATVTITVRPTGTDDTGAVAAGGTLTVPATSGLLTNDRGTGLTVTSVTTPAHGSVDFAPDGAYTYTPATGYSGPDTFRYTARDTSGQTYTRTVVLTVTPTAADDALTTPAQTPVTGDVLANDHGALTVTGTTDPGHGDVVWGSGGAFTYTPADGWSGQDTFTYTVSDGVSPAVTRTVTVTVTPTGADDAGTTPVGTPLTTGANLLANDVGDLSAALAVDAAHGTATVAADGSWTYTPAAGWSGTDTFTYTATDGAGQTVTPTVTVVVTPTAADDATTTPVGTPRTVDVADGLLANDAGALQVTSVTQPATGTVALVGTAGSYTYTPPAGWSGRTTFTYTASDGTTTLTRTVTVTVTPTAADDAYGTVVGTPLVVAGPGVLGNDAGALEVTGVGTGPANGTASVYPDGALEYVPATGWSGTDTFTYTASDGTTTLTRTVTVVVTPTAADDSGSTDTGTPLVVAGPGVLANDAGSLTVTGTGDPAHGTATVRPDGGYTYTPDTGWSGTDAFTYTASDGTTTVTRTVTVVVRPSVRDDAYATAVGVAVHGNVRDNDTGAFTSSSLVSAPSHGSLVLEADGTFTYTPTGGWSGTDTFGYRSTDGTTARTATVTLTVGALAADDSGTTPVGTPLDVDAAHGVLANDAGALGVVSHTQPGVGTVDVEADGAYVYSPPAGWSGSTTFTYTASDGTTTLTRTVTVVVTPTALADTGTTPVGTPLVVDAAAGVLANDAGSLGVTGSTQPAHGTVVVAADGSYTYTPDAGFSGVDVFTYTASDGVSPALTRTVTVTVTPSGADDSGTTPVDTVLTVPASHGVLADDQGSLAVTATGTPDHGTVVVAPDGGYVYTPPAGWSGTATFTYTASDGTSDVTHTVTVVVTPTADDDTASVATGGTLTVPAVSGLLAGDHGALVVTSTSAPRRGTVTAQPDGAYTYVPTRGWSGTDTFTYTATDGTTTLTRTVTVTVVPHAADDAGSVAAGGPTTVPADLGVLANDGGDLTVTGHTQPGHGTVAVEPDGGYTYTPPAGWSGTTTFEYTASDGTTTVTREVTLTVLPDAVDDAYGVGAGATLVVPAAGGVLANDTGALTVTGHSQPGHGTVTVDPDGAFTYTPRPGWSGTDTFTYTVGDGTTPSLTRTVTVTVAPPVVPTNGRDDQVTATPGTPVVVRPLENDPAGDHLTWLPDTLVLVDPVVGTTGKIVVVDGVGRWEVLDDGAVRFTPVDGFTGRAEITYRVTNSAGETVEASIVVRYDAPGGPGALAVTGAQAGGLLALAVLLVVGGVVLVRLRRRGRPTA